MRGGYWQPGFSDPTAFSRPARPESGPFVNTGPVVQVAATAAAVLRCFLSGRSVTIVLVLVALSLGLGAVLAGASVGHEGRLDADIGWAAAGLSGWFLSLFHGAGLAGSHRVAAPLAPTGPFSAGILLTGCWLGLAGGLSLYTAGVTVIFLAWLSGWHGAPPAAVCGMAGLLLLRLLVVLAVSTCVLALARPAVAAPLATAFCLAGWLAGNLSPASDPGVLEPLARFAGFVLPDLPALQPPLGGMPGNYSEMLATLARPTIYTALYVAAMLIAALTLFTSRIRRPGLS